jgi:hypothetical protein
MSLSRLAPAAADQAKLETQMNTNEHKQSSATLSLSCAQLQKKRTADHFREKLVLRILSVFIRVSTDERK